MPAKLQFAEPQVFVADMERARDFYTRLLGFSETFMSGDPPHYGQVVRDGCRLNLRLIREPVFVGDVRARQELLSATFVADDMTRLDAEFSARAVPLHAPLAMQPWGARRLIVCDPDGNLIMFAGS